MRNEDTVASSFCFLALLRIVDGLENGLRLILKTTLTCYQVDVYSFPGNRCAEEEHKRNRSVLGQWRVCAGAAFGAFHEGSCPRQRVRVAVTPLLTLLPLRWIPPSAVSTWPLITNGRGNSSGANTCTDRPPALPPPPRLARVFPWTPTVLFSSRKPRTNISRAPETGVALYVGDAVPFQETIYYDYRVQEVFVIF